MKVLLPWMYKELSPNFRTRSLWLIAARRKEYRKACFEAAWDAGVRPQLHLILRSITFRLPSKRLYDLDNLIARFKSGQDGLAEAMGVDDFTFNNVIREIGEVFKGGSVVAEFATTE